MYTLLKQFLKHSHPYVYRQSTQIQTPLSTHAHTNKQTPIHTTTNTHTDRNTRTRKQTQTPIHTRQHFQTLTNTHTPGLPDQVEMLYASLIAFTGYLAAP